jgi:hypothetical protein
VNAQAAASRRRRRFNVDRGACYEYPAEAEEEEEEEEDEKEEEKEEDERAIQRRSSAYAQLPPCLAQRRRERRVPPR